MSDDESFDEFYAKLNDIVNYAYNLGEIYDQPKIVQKILRSLIEDFRPKVTAITESKDVDSIPVDELVGSFQSYELDLPNTSKSKSMVISLLLKLLILPKNLEIFLRTITEGQEVIRLLNLEILGGMISLRLIALKNLKKKYVNLLII